MKVTKQDVKRYLAGRLEVDTVERVDNKQLFIVYLSDGTELLVSYYTVIGLRYEHPYSLFNITNYRYSPTTSKQVSQFRHKKNCNILEHRDFEALLGNALNLDEYAIDHLTSM